MPNFSGIWTVTQQMQAKGASTWPLLPGAPTIGTATAGVSSCASVTFTAPGCTGYPAGITGYRVISTPGCFTGTGASSPVVVSGLTIGTSYTFKAQATNATGYGALSAASNSITATAATCATYTSAGTYTWIAPTGVTSVAAVAVGGGSGAGGGLGYKNNISVTPGSSYTVIVGAKGKYYTNSAPYYGGTSSFVNTSTVRGGGAQWRTAGTYTGDGGGNGGSTSQSGGAGAGGYAGAGGNGGNPGASAGSGGGGGGAYGNNWGGGGVGIYGQGSNGAAGCAGSNAGKGGSGGGNGTGPQTSCCLSEGGRGGSYGAGGGENTCGRGGCGGVGAVRIVWCVGGIRGTPSFPSTNVGA